MNEEAMKRELITIRTETHNIENKEQKGLTKTNYKPILWREKIIFFIRILNKKKQEQRESNIRVKERTITTDGGAIKRIIKKYITKLCLKCTQNTSESAFSAKHKFFKLTQEKWETQTLQSP